MADKLVCEDGELVGGVPAIKESVNKLVDEIGAISTDTGLTPTEITESLKNAANGGDLQTRLTGTEGIINRLIDSSKSTPCAAGKLLAKLESNTSDATVFISSDSTGNETTEWVYLYAQWLASLYPTHTVIYYLFDAGIGDYNSGTTINNGTDANTLSIYNAAISGTKPDYIMGSFFSNAVVNIPEVDLFILNHGHNMITSYSTAEASKNNQRVPQFLESMQSVVRVHSGCGVLMVAQNPRETDDNYRPVYSTIVEVAGMIGADIADVYSAYEDLGKPAELYNDFIHPSPMGSELYLSVIKATHKSKAHKGVSSSLDDTAISFLQNGDFSSFDGAAPDNWSPSSNGAVEKETAITEGYNGYSVRVKPAVAGNVSVLTQTVSSVFFKSLRGKWCTLAVRVYRPSVGTSSTQGRIALVTSSATANIYTQFGPTDGWVWRCLSLKMKETDTFLQAKLYGDSGTGDAEAIFDRAVLVRGRLPKDII